MLDLPFGLRTIVRVNKENPNGLILTRQNLNDYNLVPPEPWIPDLGVASNLHPDIPIGPGVNIIVGGKGTGKTTILRAIARLAKTNIVVTYESTGPYSERRIGGIEGLVCGIDSVLTDYRARLDSGEKLTFLPLAVDSLSILTYYNPPGEDTGTTVGGRSNAFDITLKAWDTFFGSRGISAIFVVLLNNATAPDVLNQFTSTLEGSAASVMVLAGAKSTLTSRRKVLSDDFNSLDRGEVRIDSYALERQINDLTERGEHPADEGVGPEVGTEDNPYVAPSTGRIGVSPSRTKF